MRQNPFCLNAMALGHIHAKCGHCLHLSCGEIRITSAVAKIEVRRLESRSQAPLADTDPYVIAIAADHDVQDQRLPVFRLDDVASIAEFVLAWMERT